MRWAALLTMLLLARPAAAAEALVAVAANFLEPMQALAARFESETGHSLKLSAGSTGRFYAQIREGAPFDLFLAADQEHPRRLQQEGLAAEPPLTYAIGRLALWSADPALLQGDAREVLRRGAFRRLAIAKPALAPYGRAAQETLQALGLWEALRPKLVQGDSVAQAFQFVATGNAELGFVALAQVMSPERPAAGGRWLVPAELHQPIRQDALLLRRGADNPAARAAFAFLRGAEARRRIAAFGYDVGK